MIYKNRIVDSLLALKLESFGATLITGPKGCGKTTTGKQKAKSVVEFQDEDLRDNLLSVAQVQPSKLLIGENPLMMNKKTDYISLQAQLHKMCKHLIAEHSEFLQ